MAKNETKPVDPATLADDVKAFNAVQNLTDYKPAKPEAAAAALATSKTALDAAEVEFEKTDHAWDAAHDDLVEKQWAFHNGILAAKKAVVAQYDENSDEVAAIGYTKASEKKTPKPARKDPAAK